MSIIKDLTAGASADCEVFYECTHYFLAYRLRYWRGVMPVFLRKICEK